MFRVLLKLAGSLLASYGGARAISKKPRLHDTSKNSQDEQRESSGYYDYSAARLREYLKRDRAG